ncbi:hypothetical protein GGS21DRAFT_417937 [Xylaria nigripes]|nr:hypothetical protein GGS21DRAFT_417937 [Xylaria nigripes]
MSAPRTKRQFAGAASDPAQRQITSFFNTSANTPASPTTNINNNTSSIPSSRQQSDGQPYLPASVQANLLSVGMRVRKSVPEGYKTGSYSVFALWDECDKDRNIKSAGEGQRSRANAFSAPRELLPFCGIHKVGGLASQPENHGLAPSTPSVHIGGAPTASAYQPVPGFGGNNIYDNMPGLTTSQDSVDSISSSATSALSITGAQTRKRFFVEDDEDEKPRHLDIWGYNHDISVSPRSLLPVDWDNNGRVMAVPRSRRSRGKAVGQAAEMSDAGQENVMIVDSDFEEAEFLDRGVWEVDMNDA